MYKKIKHKHNGIFSVHVNNELPKIGSGHRHVEVLTMGYKWVKVRTYLGSPRKVDARLLQTHRIRRSVWDSINKMQVA
jgi:hypothetical protein